MVYGKSKNKAQLEEEFKKRMLVCCKQMAEELKEDLSSVYSWIEKNGGVETIRNLRKQYPDYTNPPDRFKKLAISNKLHLSFEVLVVIKKFEILFTEEELDWAELRLRLFKYSWYLHYWDGQGTPEKIRNWEKNNKGVVVRGIPTTTKHYPIKEDIEGYRVRGVINNTDPIFNRPKDIEPYT